MGGGGYGAGGLLTGLIMLIFFLLIVVGVILLVMWLVRQSAPPRGIAPQAGDQALETLRQRYAGGEITKEQYDQMRKDLT